MQIDFVERGNWILPREGTLGNKAKNLLENRVIIEAHDFKIPRSLVVPFEYLKEVGNPAEFTLEQIDKYFPGWLRIFVRSNAPDEDVGLRFPGLYTSANLWHTDRDNARVGIDNVTTSYGNEAAKTRRSQLGLPELGMCLLVMEPVTNTPGDFDANYSCCFSDIGELAVLTFKNPTFANINFGFNEWVSGVTPSEHVSVLAYSPTKLLVIADEVSQKGIVALADGKIHDFVRI